MAFGDALAQAKQEIVDALARLFGADFNKPHGWSAIFANKWFAHR
jgi:hypothetical protein